jgi:acetate kinase
MPHRLHRLDGIIFTGGSVRTRLLIRRLVIEHLAVLGVNIDPEMNSLPIPAGKNYFHRRCPGYLRGYSHK